MCPADFLIDCLLLIALLWCFNVFCPLSFLSDDIQSLIRFKCFGFSTLPEVVVCFSSGGTELLVVPHVVM